MSNRRRKRAAKAMPLVVDMAGADLGPVVQHERARLEVVDAADPGAPSRTIRRARVVCHYDAMWKAGTLGNPEREAADRYAVTCEREEGARDASGSACGASAPWSRTPALTAIQASASLRAAHEAVGSDGKALLRMYVRDNRPMKAIAEDRSEEREVCKGRILATLRRLAEHWGMRE